MQFAPLMRQASVTRLLCLLLLISAPLAGQESGLHVVQFNGAQWFDGTSFKPHTWYSVNGVLHPDRPFTVDETIDLSGMFVVPACGESHNHNATADNQDAIDSYLKAGIFYIENPTNLPYVRVGPRINTPDGINVIFSNGGFTAAGGHPAGLVDRNIKRGVMKPEDGEGAFYYTITTPGELEQKWPSFLSTKPDFVKTYLVYSEEFERRKDDPKYFGRRGLDPKLLPLLVAKARQSGLRIVVHVESAADFHTAVSAGVDQIAHMPGFWPSDEAIAEKSFARYRITKADARLAARKHIAVTTTLSESLELPLNPKYKDIAPALLDVYRWNLWLLQQSKVPLLIGSDRFRFNSQIEALELEKSGFMTPLSVLRSWCEVTPQAIFPKRKIGRIKDGYEANFLVVPANPLDSFSIMKDVRRRFKHGLEIQVQ